MLKKALSLIDARLSRHGRLGASLIKAVAGTAGMRLAQDSIAFVTSILIAQMLAPAGYGIYSFVLALVAFLAIPSELGIPRLAIREVAVANARKEWGYMRGFIIRAHQAIGAMTLLLVLVAIVGLSLVGDQLEATKLKSMWLGLILVPLISLGALRSAMMRGLGKVVVGQIPDQIVRPLSLLVLVLLTLFFLGDRVSAAEIMVLQILAMSIAFICGLLLYFRHRPVELARAEPGYRTSVWLMSSIPFSLTAMMQLLNGQTDVLFLGLFREDAEVGIYRVAARFSVLVIFGQQVVNAIQVSHIAHLFAVGDMQKLQKMLTRSSQAVLAVALSMVLAFVFFGPYIIELTFGADFGAAYVPLVILCVGQLVNATMGSVSAVLNMTGNERDAMRSVFISATVNVLLNLLLVPRWGAVGAAIATSTTLIVFNVMMWRLVKLRTGLDSSPLFRRRS